MWGGGAQLASHLENLGVPQYPPHLGPLLLPNCKLVYITSVTYHEGEELVLGRSAQGERFDFKDTFIYLVMRQGLSTA